MTLIVTSNRNKKMNRKKKMKIKKKMNRKKVKHDKKVAAAGKKPKYRLKILA